MGYLTESRLSELMDAPVSLPATELKQGDWVVVASVKVQQPMRISCRLLDFQLISASVDVTKISPNNKIFGNLGLAYLVLRKDYASGSPGAAGGLDTIVATGIGIFPRDTSTPVVAVEPGTYSWIVANNMQATTSSTDPIQPTTSIDFVVSCLGSVRVELSAT